MKMSLIQGKLNAHLSEGDIRYEILTSDKKTHTLSGNDVLLLKDSHGNSMSIIGPLPEQYSITGLKELLGEYYPVFVQAAFDNNPVELCKIDV